MRTALGLTFVFVLGCGSSDPGDGDTTSGLMMKADGTCSHVAACGGDVAGTWKLTEACYGVPKQSPSAECPERMTSVKVDSVNGMYAFEKAGSYTGELSIDSHVVVFFPASCLSQGGAMIRCADLSGTTDDGDMLTCTAGMAGGCSCSLPLTINLDDKGNYKPNGTKLEKDGGPFDYCVKGDRLYLEPELDMGSMSSMPMMDDLEVTLQMGFKKQ